MQQPHLLRMPLKGVNVASFRDGHVWAQKGLISGYLALDGDNSVASCSLREAILLFGLTAILCLFVCFASISEKKKRERNSSWRFASIKTNEH